MSLDNSFWSTLPGILSAVAALITAIGGMFLVLHKTGFIDSSGGKESRVTRDISQSKNNTNASKLSSQHQQYTGKKTEIVLLNQGDSRFKDWCLNVSRHTGSVTVEELQHSGCRWDLLCRKLNECQLINRGKSKYDGWHLNVKEDSEDVTVEKGIYSGTFWQIVDWGEKGIQLKNLGESKYNHWYLNVRGDNGKVTVEKVEHSGSFWRLIK